MRITKYQKSKNNTYIVTIDNEPYQLYDDIIVKYSLLLKKDITKEELTDIINANNQRKCYYQALQYLSKKMRTKKEIRNYLEKKDFNKEQINITIEKLVSEKYLDEEKYLMAYLNDALRFTTDGPQKIKQKLFLLALDKELVTTKLNEIENEVWQEKCDKLAQKKVASNHKDSRQIIIQKVTQYLLHNGYEQKYITQSLSKIDISSNLTNLKKEYDKQKQKLSKKYSESNLDFQIKMKLLNKGYTVEEINDIIF